MSPATEAFPLPLSAPPVSLNQPIALFLDLDGVLAPMAPRPDDVVPEPRRTAVLEALGRALDGRVAIVSGRTLDEIDRIAEGTSPSAAGIHGLERRDRNGTVERAEPAAGVADALSAFQDFARDRPGILVEDKAMSAGLHYRQAPASEAEARTLAGRVAEDTGLTLQPGHMVLELRTPGADKGGAVTAFMQEAPFRGAIPIMLGDDLTDEAGFIAATSLGGFGVLVGPRRQTAARHGLADVDAVLTWLEAVATEGEAR